jgi:hypothetical protein
MDGVGMTYAEKRNTLKTMAKRIPDKMTRNQYRLFFSREQHLNG